MRARHFLQSILNPRERWQFFFGRHSLLLSPIRFISNAACNGSDDTGIERNQMSELNSAMRHALTQRLCSPERPLPANRVYKQLVNPCRLVKEFDFSKSSRRLARQHAVLRFLRKHNVLLHSLLFYIPEAVTWNRTGEFDRLALYGKCIFRSEVRGRLLRLFPDMPPQIFTQCSQSLLSDNSLADLFDTLHMELIVGLRPTRRDDSGSPLRQNSQKAKRVKVSLGKAEKVNMLCAVLGEMQWFAARTKATDRTHNNALFPPSDVLILHVLCLHQLECMPAELIFRNLEPHLKAIRQVWVNEPMSLPTQLRLVPRTLAALSLSSNPHSPTSAELECRMKASSAIPSISNKDDVDSKDAVVRVRPLTAQPDTNYVKSFMKPKCRFERFKTDSYKVLHADRRGEPPLLSHEKTVRAVGAEGTYSLPDSRRRELLPGFSETD
ncbi:unnamed protein product [Phytomonas sp. EM1]|nr:unnamed protein product [Phytomonas sp. EM1]|eukprot:CCW61022.1 unnamed protein product [Phytomonas sp. isolate EM1]